MAKVRLADIAKKVGVSTVTVHNALSGQKGVSEDLRQTIQETAKSMGYQTSPSSNKRDSSERFKNIGVLISERYLADYTTFYWKMYQEMALIATDRSCMVAVEIIKHDAEDNLNLPRIIEENTVEGVIIMGEVNRDYIHHLQSNVNIPLVFLDFYDKELAKDAVISDNFYGMYQVSEYVIEQGFTKLAFVGSIYATSSIMDRYCGFYKATLEHGIATPDEWIIEDRDTIGNIEFDLPEKMPQAFVCNCDLTAGILIMKLEQRGIRVPEDISVVGFDNFLYPGFADMKITTYEVNTKAMARIALEKVLKQLKNRNSGRGLNIVSGNIVIKESVAKA